MLDATTGYLSCGECVNWPEPVEHLGDLAMLAHRDRLRLGHGGGETIPEPGQIWLWDAATMQRLGLPASIAIEGAEQLSQDAFEKATTEALGALDDHPMLTRAKAAGWQFGQGGHLHVFTALWHPDLLPGGARIVVRPWHRLTNVALFEHSTDPAGLAQNIAQFADTVGIPYRISPGATALDLIDHTRPPRRSQDGISGSNERRVAVVRGEPAELPRFLRNPDSRTRLVESDYSWWRPWTSLLQEEQQRRYVHAYDRGASYLAQWSGVQLGVEGLIHRTGAEAAWDGSEEPGYYLFDKDWEWPAWGLPQPTWLAVVEGGRVWGTSHTLRQLAAVGISPTIHESYTWQTTARYLDKAAQRLREARRHPNPAVSATAKAAYAAGTGKLAERRHHDSYHLWRPDWRDHVIAASRTGILRTLQAIEARCGDHALAVARDSIVFASAQADPVAAWPGDPGKIGTSPGQWKPEGTGLLADWGPTHLTERGRSRYWRHIDAMDALTGLP